MKRYKLSDLHIGMKVYVDELYDIEGVYILLKNPKVVQDGILTRTEGVIEKISTRKLRVTHDNESLYYRKKGYLDQYVYLYRGQHNRSIFLETDKQCLF